MTLVSWRPSRYATGFDRFDRLFDAFQPKERGPETRTLWRPRVDVAEQEDGWTLEMDLPGVPRENVKVTAQKGVLTIEGEASRIGEDASGQRWSERPGGAFRRSFRLPEAVDVTKVTAEQRDGVLRVRLPKAEAAKPRQIEVSVN